MKVQHVLLVTMILCLVGVDSAYAINVKGAIDSIWDEARSYIGIFVFMTLATICGVYLTKLASGNLLLQVAITASFALLLTIAPMAFPGQIGSTFKQAWGGFVGIFPGI